MGTSGLNKREVKALTFIAEQKAISYLHLAQYLAPNYEPAIIGLAQENQSAPAKRGGNRRHAPWPLDRQLRLKAVSRLIMEWEHEALVRTERPWKDRPKWVWVTAQGLRRLGLEYNDAHFLEDEEELDHLYQITRIRLLIGHRPENARATWFAHTWISERTIKATYPQNTAGLLLPHLPDGALELEEDAEVKMNGGVKLPFRRGECIAVEVERSRKNFARLDGIVPNLLKHYAGVWYFCRPKAADAIHATLDRLYRAETLTAGQVQRIRVLDLAEEEE